MRWRCSFRIIPKWLYWLDWEVERIQFTSYTVAESNPPPATFPMKIYDTNYGPDIFGRIRMGLITEMFLTFDGFIKPDIGDQLRISCMFKGVIRDVYTVEIEQVCDCVDEPQTVLIRIEKSKPNIGLKFRDDEKLVSDMSSSSRDLNVTYH